MLENPLPPAYAAIRQMLRYTDHTEFEAYFNDLRTQVKAEERSSMATAPTAFVASDENSSSTPQVTSLRPFSNSHTVRAKVERGAKAEAIGRPTKEAEEKGTLPT